MIVFSQGAIGNTHAEYKYPLLSQLYMTVSDGTGITLRGLHFLTPFLRLNPYNWRIELSTFMPSLEHLPFQPRNMLSPDTKTGGGSSGQTEPKIPLQDVSSDVDGGLPDNSLSTSLLEAIYHYPPVPDLQDTLTKLETVRQDQSIEQQSAVNGISTSESTEKNPGDYNEKQFCWWRDLSPNAQRLYEILIEQGGDRDVLPGVAEHEGWNLDEALKEISGWGFLDESDSIRYKLQ